MKLHTKLYSADIREALLAAKLAGKVTYDIEFVQFAPQGSRTHEYGWLIQLGTYDKTTGPTRSRHYKNSGTDGAGNLWAATYDEWGWFIAELFRRDPDARFGNYKDYDDFMAKTDGKYVVKHAPKPGTNAAVREHDAARHAARKALDDRRRAADDELLRRNRIGDYDALPPQDCDYPNCHSEHGTEHVQGRWLCREHASDYRDFLAYYADPAAPPECGCGGRHWSCPGATTGIE